jgi:chromosome segregation ATPase
MTKVKNRKTKPKHRPLRLTLSNISGLEGTHQYAFERGLNILHGRNSSGLSSIVDALYLVTGGQSDGLTDLLHASATRGNVKLQSDSEEWDINLLRSENGVVFGSRKPLLLDSRMVNIAIVDTRHPLTGKLSDETIKTFLDSMSGSQELQREVAKHAKTIEKQETEIDAKKKEIQDLEASHQQYVQAAIKKRASTAEIRELAAKVADSKPQDEKERKDMAERLRERLATLRGNSKQLQETAQKAREQITSLEKQIRDGAPPKKIEQLQQQLQALKYSVPVSVAAAKFLGQLVNHFSAYKRALSQYEELQKKSDSLDKGDTDTASEIESALNEIKRLHADFETCTICALSPATSHRTTKMPIRERINLSAEAAEKTLKLKDEIIEKQGGLLKRQNDVENELNTLMSQRDKLEELLEKQKATLKQSEMGLRIAEGDILTTSRALEDLEEQSNTETEAKASRKDENLQQLMEKDDEFRRKNEELDGMEKRRKRNIELKKEAEQKYEQRLHAARELFNKEVSKVMRELGFYAFKSLEVDDKFHVKIQRQRKDGGSFSETLSQLAEGEAAVITLLLALAAKVVYAPEFPFLAIDTVTAHIRPTPFNRFVEYAASKVDYLIVTSSFSESNTIQVAHSTKY